MHKIDRKKDDTPDQAFLRNDPHVNKIFSQAMGLDGEVEILNFAIAASSLGARQAYASVRHGDQVHAAALTLNYRPGQGGPEALGFEIYPEGQSAMDEDLVNCPKKVLEDLTPSDDLVVKDWRCACLSSLVFAATRHHPVGGTVIFIPEGHSREGKAPCHIFLVDDPRSTFSMGLDGELHSLLREQVASSIPVPEKPISDESADRIIDMADQVDLSYSENTWKREKFGVVFDPAVASQAVEKMRGTTVMNAVATVLGSVEDPAMINIEAHVKACESKAAEYYQRVGKVLEPGNYGVARDPAVIDRLSEHFENLRSPSISAMANA